MVSGYSHSREAERLWSPISCFWQPLRRLGLCDVCFLLPLPWAFPSASGGLAWDVLVCFLSLISSQVIFNLITSCTWCSLCSFNRSQVINKIFWFLFNVFSAFLHGPTLTETPAVMQTSQRCFHALIPPLIPCWTYFTSHKSAHFLKMLVDLMFSEQF